MEGASIELQNKIVYFGNQRIQLTDQITRFYDEAQRRGIVQRGTFGEADITFVEKATGGYQRTIRTIPVQTKARLLDLLYPKEKPRG